MEKILHQKKFQEFKKYTITEDFLEVEFKEQGEYHKFNLSFDNIDFQEHTMRDSPSGEAIGFFISFFVNIFLLIILFADKLKQWNVLQHISAAILPIATIWSVNTFKQRKLKYLKGYSNIAFYYSSEKQRQEVDQFIIDLKEAKRNYIRKKYFLLDELLSLEELEQQFKWLYRDKYISKSEYDFMMEELQAKRLF